MCPHIIVFQFKRIGSSGSVLLSYVALITQPMSFSLPDSFVDQYRNIQPPFGFDGLGYFVYKRTYSRVKDDGTNEEWYETVRRVVEGTFSLQKRHINAHGLRWNNAKGLFHAKEMYDRIFHMKFLPPGRGLWSMGSPITEERHVYAALNNCAFVSTSTIKEDLSKPFEFLMDMSMLGVGVGFDTRGAGEIMIHKPSILNKTVAAADTLTHGTLVPPVQDEKYSNAAHYIISDDREGWVQSLRLLLQSYFVKNSAVVEFDYTQIREAGLPINGFGGMTSGPKPLMQLHETVRELLDRYDGRLIDSVLIVDIMNLIGRCVVAGNVRRTAEIVFGDYNDKAYINLKNKDFFPERNDWESGWGWTSNNSIFAELGMDYSEVARLSSTNGEPGYAWLDNMRDYGRMIEPKNYKDHRAMGGNPCVPAGTKILTDAGYVEIDKKVGKWVNVWNGLEFSPVVPRITGYDQELVKVVLSDGTSLICTPYHEWILSGGQRVQTKDLVLEEDKLEKFEMPVIEGKIELPSAYTQGFYTGDGQTSENGTKGALLYGEKKALLDKLDTPSKNNQIKGDRVYVSFPNLEFDKWFVPDTAYSIQSRLNWLAGLFDADGCVLTYKNGKSIQLVSTEFAFLSELRLMLTTLGVQAKISTAMQEGYRLMPNGRGGTSQYWCEKTYRILINATDVKRLTDLGLVCHRLDLSNNNPQRDARRFVTVVSVEDAGYADVVYCFTEPKNNTGTFEGIVTGQCLEQTLESYELCCLVETNLSAHTDLEDYLKTLKYAYMYAKTVTLGMTHWPETNRVMLRNRRIGTSVTGAAQFADTRGIETLRKWLDKGYAILRHYDEIYSDWFAVPRSIKMSSVKPSGTVSKVMGVWAGMHRPDSRYIKRAVRISNQSPLLGPLIDAGYEIEPSINDPVHTAVVYFPIDMGEGRTNSEVSIWEQMAFAAFLQEHWADNQVSCTISFDPETEADQIAPALNLFQYKLKGISFLPRVEHGAYPQMPEQAITKAEYLEMKSRLKPLNFTSVNENKADVERFCDGDVCQIG
jgi:ribonucleotide reductase alpha subunit